MKKSKFKSRNILATNVAYLRHNKGWSQEELANRANISSTFISDIENAKSNVGIDHIDNLSYAFSLDTPELLTDHGYIVTKSRVDSKQSFNQKWSVTNISISYYL